MINKITLPKYNEKTVKKHEYYNHYMFIKKYAEYIGIKTEIINENETVFCGGSNTYFSCEIDKKQVIIDYSDHLQIRSYFLQKKIPVLKYHYSIGHENIRGMYPIGPMIDFPDIQTYKQFFRNYVDTDIYDPQNNKKIMSIQMPGGAAYDRRIMVQDMLTKKFGENALTRKHYKAGLQQRFWNLHKSCMVAVCVPGARIDILDRGHYEELAMGFCTISPKIITYLPGGVMINPNVHYIECYPNYADLIDKIQWCMNNKEKIKEIGNNAKELFKKYCMPQKYWNWVEKCIKQEF